MRSRRIDAAPLIALAGAVLLLVSLFLEWYEPDLTAWEVFEVIDLVLATAAVVALLAAASAAGARSPAVDPRALGWAAAAALALVLVSLIDEPPAARGLGPGTGLWLALAGSALMAVGALLSLARVRVSLDVQGREARGAHEAEGARGNETTAAMPATPAPAEEERPPESRL